MEKILVPSRIKMRGSDRFGWVVSVLTDLPFNPQKPASYGVRLDGISGTAYFPLSHFDIIEEAPVPSPSAKTTATKKKIPAKKVSGR